MRATSWQRIVDDLSAAVDALEFAPPVAQVYNPLVYARRPHERYLDRFGQGRKEVLLLGMNPGPWGMAQTGIPFGEITHARDFLGVEAAVDRPRIEHPARPIRGFACTRSEVSGARLWGFVRRRFATPERFFARYFVANYCPLVFMEESGRNRTPDKLPAREREPLYAACDEALRRIVHRLGVRFVVGIGRFAERRAREALADLDLQFGTLPHPSPANPAANRDWDAAAAAALTSLGLLD